MTDVNNVTQSNNAGNNISTFEIYEALKDRDIHTAPIKIDTKQGVYQWNKTDIIFSENDFENSNIGLVTGRASGIMALDIDIECQEIQKEIDLSLPPLFCGRRGNRARMPGRLYTPSEELQLAWKKGSAKKNLVHIGVEFKFNTLFVIPPSVHPKGYKYEWVGVPLIDENLNVLDIDDLPIFGMDEYKYFEKLNSVFKQERFSKEALPLTAPGSRSECMGGSYPEMSRVMVGHVIHGKPFDEVVEILLSHDRKINIENGYASFFNCSRRSQEGTFQGRAGRVAAEWFVGECFKRHERNIVRKPIDAKADYLLNIIPTEAPKVEKGSFINLFDEAIRRNQFVEGKKMSFVTALSTASWLTSLNTRFLGNATNLILLFISPSGSGKSTSSRAIKALIKLIPRLAVSFQGSDMKTEAAVASAFEGAPVGYYLIDEYTKVAGPMGNKNSHNATLPELICALTTDYGPNDPPHYIRLKNETYGVCQDPKLNMLSFSTDNVWQYITVENYMQGLGRRMIIVEDQVVRDHVVGKEPAVKYFNQQEEVMLKQFIETVILPDKDLFKDVNISQYQLIKSKIITKGKTDIKYWDQCKSAKANNILSPSEDVKKYLKFDLPTKINELKKEIKSRGSKIDLFLVSSMAEQIPKLAAIHTMCGKCLIDLDRAKKYNDLSFKVNTVVEMDSIKWAEQTYLYYVVGALSERLGTVLGQEEKTDSENSMVADLIEYLKEKDTREFKKSDDVIKNFFKTRGGTKNRDNVLSKAIASGSIDCNGDFGRRGVEFSLR